MQLQGPEADVPDLSAEEEEQAAVGARRGGGSEDLGRHGLLPVGSVVDAPEGLEGVVAPAKDAAGPCHVEAVEDAIDKAASPMGETALLSKDI